MSQGVVAQIDGKRYKYLKQRKGSTEWLFDLSSPEAENLNIKNIKSQQETLTKLRLLNANFER